MSTTRKDYVILGFDLSPYREQIYTDEWRTDENIDKWECYQTKDNIQLFTDPMSGAHLYFGYIISAHNEWDPDVVATVSMEDMLRLKQKVNDKLYETGLGITDRLEYKVICFTEWR